jgi:hypothetical protein
MKQFRIPTTLALIALLIISCTAQESGKAAPKDSITSDTEEAPDETPPTTASSSPEVLAENPDLSDITIRLYQIADKTSDEANYISSAINGAADMVGYINATGGIFGARFEIHHYETNGSPEAGLAAFMEIAENDPDAFVVLVYDPWLALALAPLAREHQIPVLTTAAGDEALYDLEAGYVFSLAPTYSDQAVRVLTFLYDNWDEYRPVSVDTINLAVFRWPDPKGQRAITPAVADYVNGLGIEIVHTVEIPYSYTVDLTNDAVDANSALANIIWSEMSAFGPARLMDDMDWVALNQVMLLSGSGEGFDLTFRGFILDQAHAAGAVVPFYTEHWDEDSPGIAFALENFAENERSPSDKTIGRLISQAGIDLIHEVLEAYLLDQSIEGLSGQSFYAYLTEVNNYDALDGLIQYNFTDGQRSPQQIGILQLGETMDDYTIIDPIRAVTNWRD